MRIFLVEFEVSVADIVKPADVYQLNKWADIDHSALTLDQTMFGGRNEFDWVLFTKHHDIKFDEFLSLEKYIPRDSKIIFSALENTLECFYCRPEVYSILGSMYKTQDNVFFMLARQQIEIQKI